jgi:glycosyltransferase involved in cell wall biosynthesis
MKITVTMLSKNCAETIQASLKQLNRFSEVILLDTGSNDKTLEIARQFPNVKIHSTNFNGFGPLHNFATSLAANDWILSVDSDEVLTADLIDEIEKLSLDPACVYSIQRDNYFNQKLIRFCSWYPDRVVRLYHRDHTKFSDEAVHEQVIANGMQIIPLQNPLKHTPYRSTGDFLDKMQKYSTLFAEQNRGKKSSSFVSALLHGSAAFTKNYFLKGGIFGGKEGFIISVYNGQTAYYKYLKLAELNKKL